jgi:hypothetical protein
MSSGPPTPAESNVTELYTLPTFRVGVDWQAVATREHCAYLDTRCAKTRKSAPDVTIGTCSVRYGVRDPKDMVICPYRFLERNQIFTDCLHLLTRHEPGNELHRVSELTIPGGSVDYCLASVRKGKVVDFVAIELQAVDTTGTVWPERQRFLQSAGVRVDRTGIGNFGMNWKMSAKTILIQLHHKIQTFENVNRHFVLVLQDHFLNAMEQSFAFGHIGAANISDSMHFHAYAFNRTEEGYRLELASRRSTDSAGIGICLGLQASPAVELETIHTSIEQKIARASGRTLLTF